MSERLAATIALYALFLAAASGFQGALGRGPGPAISGGMMLLELALIAQAGLAIGAVAAGDRPAEPSTFVGYLAASVVVLPAAAGYGRGGAGWGSVIIAVACVALAVVAWRLTVTWAGAA